MRRSGFGFSCTLVFQGRGRLKNCNFCSRVTRAARSLNSRGLPSSAAIEPRPRLASLTVHQSCRGSFSSVSTLLIARVGECFSIFRIYKTLLLKKEGRSRLCTAQMFIFALFLFFFVSLRFPGFFVKFCGFFSKSSVFAANFPEFYWNCGKLQRIQIPEFPEFCRKN